MANVTAKELVEWATSLLGTPYVYGMKYQVLTQSLLNSLAATYPSTFTSSYIKKAQAFIGQKCVDCSGVISSKTGIERNSSGYKSTAEESVGIGALDESMIGWAVWKSGHIGVYIGDGYCIEARGIDYGTIKSKVADRTFTHAIKLCDIDYSEQPVVYVEGWKQEPDGRWWYQYADGTYPVNGWYWLHEETGNTDGWYLFDAEGWMLTGIQTDAAGETYLLDPIQDNHEGQCMWTDERGVLIPGNNYDFENHKFIL